MARKLTWLLGFGFSIFATLAQAKTAGTPPPVDAAATPPQTLPTPNAGGTPAPAGGAAPAAGGNNTQQPATPDTQKSDKETFLIIDLASPAGTYPRNAGTYKLKLINKIPSATYIPRSKIYSGSLSHPFDVSLLSRKAAAPDGPGCAPAKTQLDGRVSGAMCESEIASVIQSYKSFLSSAGCAPTTISDYGSDLEKLTQWEDSDSLPEVSNGDSIEISIARDQFFSTSAPASKNVACSKEDVTAYANDPRYPSSIKERNLGTWNFDIGKKEAQWLIYYGFNFAKGGDQNYFAKSNSGSNPATYTITPDADRGGRNFSASIYFFRMPADTGIKDNVLRVVTGWHYRDAMGGLTAGLGFDLDNPTVFLGYGLGWGDNIVLTAGVVMHKEKRLKGQYESGDIVSENLTSDQLLDSTYKPRPYIGLAFRFGSNPFKSDDNGKPAASDQSAPKTK